MPVLGTKLHLPSPRRRLVQRARLTGELRADGGEGPRLVLVAAPAGFGKTTLLAQWLAAPRSTALATWAMERTWAVRLDAITLTSSVRFFQ
jgi:LuxR family transcriptional regulator, maltose regulon positive regulatory protein